MWKIFQGRFDTPIVRPSGRQLVLSFGALVGAFLSAFVLPEASVFMLFPQGILAGFLFIGGAHRTAEIRVRVPAGILPVICTTSFVHSPWSIPQGLLLAYAAFTLGNAWKYWYLQRDPRRLSPEYRFFKDPRTRPQQRIIYGVSLMVALAFPVAFIVYMLFKYAVGFAEPVAAAIGGICGLIVFLVGLLWFVFGVVGVVLRWWRRF